MRYHRKTAPGVKGGRVQKKNGTRGDHDYTRTHQVRVERFPAHSGYRHYVSPTDIHAFLNILPDWRELSIGLTRVVLSARTDCHGWCDTGAVAVCAWEERPWHIFSEPFYRDHAGTFRRLGVPCRPAVSLECWCLEEVALVDGFGCCEGCGCTFGPKDAEDGGLPGYLAEFTDETVQAFLLVHVLVHELGHHHDRMTSPRQGDTTRGEGYAEEYALKHEKQIWDSYRRVFRLK